MRHILPPLCVLGFFCASGFTSPAADSTPWKWQDALVPDVGFDLDAARVVRVTSLAATGKGTLSEALKLGGPRLIVFEVGGVIDLGMESLVIKEPRVLVAGQTAPPPGITLIRGGIRVSASRTVLQHLCIRPGDAGQPKKSGWEPDGITTSGGPADVWIDHCSVTWSCDENISAATYEPPAGDPARRIFIRDCIIAEGLGNASHAKGEHSMGTLVFNGTQQVAIVGNLYASNAQRNPAFGPNTSGVVVNNLIANPQNSAIDGYEPDGKESNARLAVVANIVLFGENTKRSVAIFEGVADAFFKGNEGRDRLGKPVPELRAPFPTLPNPPLWPEGLEARGTTAALWHIARFVGARPAQRDEIDIRIVRDALTGAARIIASQDEVGGYPRPDPTTRALDVPARERRSWLEKLAGEVTFGPQ